MCSSFHAGIFTVRNSSCGKVMFSFCHSVQVGGSVVHPQRQIPLDRHPPPKTANAADGTYPTGMHSCSRLKLLRSTWLWEFFQKSLFTLRVSFSAFLWHNSLYSKGSFTLSERDLRSLSLISVNIVLDSGRDCAFASI